MESILFPNYSNWSWAYIPTYSFLYDIWGKVVLSDINNTFINKYSLPEIDTNCQFNYEIEVVIELTIR